MSVITFLASAVLVATCVYVLFCDDDFDRFA